MPRFHLTSRNTATLFVLGLTAALAMGCTMPSAEQPPSGLALRVTVPAGATGSAASGLGDVTALELSSGVFRLLIADDVGLASGGSFRSRFRSDAGSIEDDAPSPALSASYIASSLSWTPGQSLSAEFNNLNAGARYAIVVYAELTIEDNPGEFSTAGYYGYTRVLTSAGEVSAAAVNLNASYQDLAAQMLSWYGITLPPRGLPTLLTVPPSFTNPDNDPVIFIVGGAQEGETFVYSLAGPTPLTDEEVPADAAGQAEIPLTGLADGAYTFTVFIRDADGNNGPSSEPYSFVVDTVPPDPPTVDFIANPDFQGTPPNLYTLNQTPTISWTGSGEAGATWEYSIDSGATWTIVTTPSVTLGPLTTGINYGFIVREIDAAGNESGPTPLNEFLYTEGASSTISITNPAVPTFSIDNGGVTLDRSVPPDEWNLVTAPGDGVTITAFDWLVNGVSTSTAQNFTLIATDPSTNLGANTLTLFVQIDGMWYSDSFVFQVVEN